MVETTVVISHLVQQFTVYFEIADLQFSMSLPQGDEAQERLFSCFDGVISFEQVLLNDCVNFLAERMNVHD